MKLTTFALAALTASSACPQGLEYIKANYTKYEYEIAMRDGKKLFTAVYAPKDTSRQYPIMLLRTPYSVGPYGEDNYKTALGPSEIFAKDQFIFAYQDVRGRWMSEGEYMNVRPHKPLKHGPADVDESTDTWDSIDWLVKHVPNNNGRVGMWGISYPGFYAAAGMIDAHPALKAVSPQAPVGDWYFDDFLHNGAFFLAHAYRWLGNNDQARPKPTGEKPPPVNYPTLDGYKLFLDAGRMENVSRE